MLKNISMRVNSVCNHIVEGLLCSFGMSVLFQIVLYFLNLPFSLFSFFLPFILYPLFQHFVLKRKTDPFNILVAYAVILFISLGFMAYFKLFLEHSFDGNMYHGESMVQILKGWNPVYNTNPYVHSYGFEWSILYPKFTWIYSAFWIKLTGMSSSGMFLNAFVGIITSIKIYLYVDKRIKSKLFGIIIGVLVFLNPIFIEQLHSFYVDALMSNLLLLLILYNLELTEEFSLDKLFYITLISVLLINIKFTGFAFAGLIDLAAFIFLIVTNRKNAFKYFIAGILIIVFGVVIFGYSPYIVNILKGRHIFYPLLGKDKWDIITSLIPEPMLQLRTYERFLYSLSMGKPYFENLFSLQEHGYLYYDQRIGGFGGQFFKLLILSITIIGLTILLRIKKLKLNEVLIFIFFSISILINFRNIWWARYAAHLWYLVPLAVYVLFAHSKFQFIKNTIIFLIVFLVIFQSQDIYKHTFERDRLITEEAYTVYESLRLRNNLTIYVDGAGINQFSVFEEFKSRENGLDIKTVLYELPTVPYECFRLDNYQLCVVK